MLTAVYQPVVVRAVSPQYVVVVDAVSPQYVVVVGCGEVLCMLVCGPVLFQYHTEVEVEVEGVSLVPVE